MSRWVPRAYMHAPRNGRKSLDQKFAVLMMRSAYETADALDFIPMARNPPFPRYSPVSPVATVAPGAASKPQSSIITSIPSPHAIGFAGGTSTECFLTIESAIP